MLYLYFIFDKKSLKLSINLLKKYNLHLVECRQGKFTNVI